MSAAPESHGREVRVRITREVLLPDPIRAARLEKSPELGPKILFFSGGSALRDLSRRIIRYTHNSIHVVTPFDSGGSSARLREAFRMPAVGDVRNRLMALADRSIQGNPEIFALFTHRMDRRGSAAALARELDRMVRGSHPLTARIPDPMRKIVRRHIALFRERMPERFDLRGASVGNLVLAAGYLENRRHLDPVIYVFSKLVQVRGTVRPVVNSDLHLAGWRKPEGIVVGQHRLTARDGRGAGSRIERIWLTGGLDGGDPLETEIRRKVRDLIAEAELICYPMGSFFTSVVANLLPRGVGEAIRRNPCPKVFIPNTGRDPESRGLSVADQARMILKYAGDEKGGRAEAREALDFVLLDRRNGLYPEGVDEKAIDRLGLRTIRCDLARRLRPPLLDGENLARVLVSLT